MTSSEALPQQPYQLPYQTTTPLEANSYCRSSAEQDCDSTSYLLVLFLAHMDDKGSVIHCPLNSNGASILIRRDNYLLCFLM